MKGMKTIATLLIITCLSLIAATRKEVFGYRHSKDKSNSNLPIKGFALIELFTSEGCSSCPPADELIARIQKENNDQPVYILSFHVDYWNHLGWKDSFSSPAYSKRQSQYVAWLNLQSAYTPQVVINGRKEFVGSEESTLRNAIKTSLQKTPQAQIILKDVQIRQGQVNLKYQTEGAVQPGALVLALVQKSATTDVKRGENGGRKLSHVQIVRSLQTIPFDPGKEGIVHIDLPDGLNPANAELIAFLQNNANGEIIAAAKFSLGTFSSINKMN